MKKLITTTTVVLAFAAVAAGCGGGGSGSRSGKPVYGPGSTGHLGGTGSTTGGVTNPGGSGGSGTGSFSAAPAMSAPRAMHTATVLADGRVLVVGGTDAGSQPGVYKTAEVFDPLANGWTQLPGMLNLNGTDTARQQHTATLVGNQVLIAGGFGVETAAGQFTAMTSCFLFDPNSNSFTPTGALPQARGWHLAAPLPNGQVVVAGGMDDALNSVTTSAVFDPSSGQWTAGGSSGHHMWGAMVTAGQQTVIVGGCQAVYNQANAQAGQFPWDIGLSQPVTELFDAQSRTFGQAPTNAGDRLYYAGAASSQGKALFAGGYEVTAAGQLALSDGTEVYDAASNTFTPGSPMSVARESAVVAEIGTSGDMLVIGGFDANSGAATPVCEVFQMSSTSVVGQASMAEGRYDHQAVTLNDGRIMVIGGAGTGGGLDSCEFYTR